MKIVSKSNNLSMPKVIGNRYVYQKLGMGSTLTYNDKELQNIVVKGALTKFKTLYSVVDDTVDSLKAEQTLNQIDIKKDDGTTVDATVDAKLAREEYVKAINAKFAPDAEPTDTELWKATDENAYKLFANKKDFLEVYHTAFAKVIENVNIESDNP